MCRNLTSGRRSTRQASVSTLTGLSIFLAIFLVSCAAGAANWELAPRVMAGYKYNDNYRLDQPGAEIDVSGGEADAALTLRNLDPRTRFEITPRINATYFPDERDEDSTDYYLNTTLSDTTPRRRMGFGFNYSREDVVRSELPSSAIDEGLGEVEGGDAGRVLQRNRRDYFRVAPYFSYDISQRYRAEADAHYLRADFDEQFVGAQQDFDEAGASAGLGYLLSERTSLTFRGIATQYETTFKTDAYGGEVEWANDITQTSHVYVRGGAQQTKPENSSSDTNFIFGMGGRWNSPRNALFVDLTRTVNAISAGTVVERHQLRIRIDHDVSPRLALQFGARASRDEEIGDGTYPTRKYATADAGLEWRIQRFLALTATYNYRWQEYADEPSDASANGFLIGIVYEPKRAD